MFALHGEVISDELAARFSADGRTQALKNCAGEQSRQLHLNRKEVIAKTLGGCRHLPGLAGSASTCRGHEIQARTRNGERAVRAASEPSESQKTR